MTGIHWHGKLWRIVDAQGKPVLDTIADTRAASIAAYEQENWETNVRPFAWDRSRKLHGLRCVPFVADLQEEC